MIYAQLLAKVKLLLVGINLKWNIKAPLLHCAKDLSYCQVASLMCIYISYPNVDSTDFLNIMPVTVIECSRSICRIRFYVSSASVNEIDQWDRHRPETHLLRSARSNKWRTLS